MKHWLQAWCTPCRFSIGSPLRREFSIRPLSLLAGVLACCLFIVLITLKLAPKHQDAERLARQHYQLQRDNEQLKTRLAEAEATLMLRNEQIRHQQQQIEEQEQQIAPMRKRLSLLENILLKRRDKGTHILTGAARWNGTQLQLNIVLVKGGNYPREVEGRVEVLAQDPEGTLMPLLFAHGRDHLAYRMKTHTLLQENVTWPHDWRPEQLFIILRNAHGREIERITVWVGGTHD